MKATGIVRKIDRLGRILIPMEIRRTMRIRENDLLEIFTDREGQIILKKYSSVGEMGQEIRDYAKSAADALDCTVCITDTDQVAALSGKGKKEFHETFISKELQEAIRGNTPVFEEKGSQKYINITEREEDFDEEIIVPVNCGGDPIGAVIFLNKDAKKPFDEGDKKVAGIIADIIGKTLGQ